jgi:hypothetical protein
VTDVEMVRSSWQGRPIVKWFASSKPAFLRLCPPDVPAFVFTSLASWHVNDRPFYVEVGPDCIATKRCPDASRPCRCELNDLYGLSVSGLVKPPAWWVAAVRHWEDRQSAADAERSQTLHSVQS